MHTVKDAVFCLWISHWNINYGQHNLSSWLPQWCIWGVYCFEGIIKKLSDFSLVKSKSFLRSSSAPGCGTWSTEKRREVGGVEGGKGICRWELVVPINTWSQRGNKMILFTCKACAAKTHCFSSTAHRKIGRHHLNSYFAECSFSSKPLRLYFEHEHIM